jgi:hypothetical protein
LTYAITTNPVNGQNFISFDAATMTISIQTDDNTYTDTTFTVTITGTNSASEDITQSFDVITQDCTSAFSLDAAQNSNLAYTWHDALTLYAVSSFFLSDNARCVATFSMAYSTGTTLDNSHAGSNFLWYVPGDNGFYVETIDNGDVGTLSLVATLTNTGVTLSQSITLTISPGCSLDIVAKTNIGNIVVPDVHTLNADGNYEYTMNLDDIVTGGDDS